MIESDTLLLATKLQLGCKVSECGLLFFPVPQPEVEDLGHYGASCITEVIVEKAGREPILLHKIPERD